jgi:hypothetical protein
VVFAIAQLTPAVATARTATAVRTGVIQWLERNQRSDGAWDTGYASQRPLATAEALLALAKASRGTHVTARRAVGWLRTRELASIDLRGRRLRSMVSAGEAEATEVSALLALRNGSLGWGLVGPVGPGAYDTALALDGIEASGLLSIEDRDLLVASILDRRRFDYGWSGDGMPESDGPSDLTTTAEITRALAGKGIAPQDLHETFALLEAPPTENTPTLEIAARLAALYRHGRNWAPTIALEAELLRDGRFPVGSDVWFNPNPHLYAIGLLALTTKPGATFTSPPVQADQDRDGIPDFPDLDRDGDGVVVGDLFPTDPRESFDWMATGRARPTSTTTAMAWLTPLRSAEMDSLDPDTGGWLRGRAGRRRCRGARRQCLGPPAQRLRRRRGRARYQRARSHRPSRQAGRCGTARLAQRALRSGRRLRRAARRA